MGPPTETLSLRRVIIFSAAISLLPNCRTNMSEMTLLEANSICIIARASTLEHLPDQATLPFASEGKRHLDEIIQADDVCSLDGFMKFI